MSVRDSLAGWTITSESKSADGLLSVPRGFSIEKRSGRHGGWLDAESGSPWPKVATENTEQTIPAQRSNLPRLRTVLGVEIRVFTGLRPFDWFGFGCQDNQSTVDCHVSGSAGENETGRCPSPMVEIGN